MNENKPSLEAISLFQGNISDEDIAELMSRNDYHDGLLNSEVLATSIFKDVKPGSYNAEYRGWYGSQTRPRWCPSQSKFNGRNGQHKGADIFALRDTELVALVDGRIQWNPKGGGGSWGNHIFLNFRYSNRNYTFVYAHLDSLVGRNNRAVKHGEVICKSGCSGNTVYCGTFNNCDGKEDHIHLELHSTSGRIDPIAFLRWSMKYESDNQCYYASC